MSYTLRLTNGKILVTLADQQLDTVSTSLTLIGKNVNAYGDDINTNFIHLLENFSGDTEPTSPLVGQLWFDRTNQRINVYTDSLQFKPVGGPILSNTVPEGLVAGDLWINTQKTQISFYDGNRLTLIGPEYDSTLGKSGVLVENVYDSGSNIQTVSLIYANGSVLGTISSSTFTPRIDYLPGLNGIAQIKSGITLAPSLKFYGTATNTDSFGGVSVNDIILSSLTATQILNSQINIYNDDGITLGDNEDLALYVDPASRVATVSVSNVQDFEILTKTNSDPDIACLHFSSSTGYLGFFTKTPTEKIDVVGNVKIQGNLIVEGSSTYVTTQDLVVLDKTITLANTATTDAQSVNGGIVLNGLTPKSITWVGSSVSWKSSENFDLNSGKTYKINGTDVLTSTSLGTGISSALGLTRVGVLNSLTVQQVYVTSATIGTTIPTSLVLGTGFSTDVDFNGKVLRNAYTVLPGDPEEVDDTVATVGYVLNKLASNIAGQFALQLDVTGLGILGSADPNIDIFVNDALNAYLLPPSDPDYGIRPGSRARVMITRMTTSATTAVSNPIGFASISVYEAGTTSPVDVVVNDRPYVASTTVPSRELKVDRVVKQYRVNNSYQWEAYPAGANTIHVYGSW